MTIWNSASTSVSEFVNKFLDRALGATNELEQRVPIHDPLHNKFYLGKLLPLGAAIGITEYQVNATPSSYITTFLVAGHPSVIKLQITPSFNLYFRPAIHIARGEKNIADPGIHQLYSDQADPAPGALSGRADMWIGWKDRLRTVPNSFTDAVKALEVPPTVGERFRRKYNLATAIDAYIRKRYCTTVTLAVPTSSSAKQVLDLTVFRTAYLKLGSAPQWQGQLEAFAVPEDKNTRVTVFLTNTFPNKNSPSGDPHWYDTHLQITLLDGQTVIPIPCPVLASVPGNTLEVLAESKNCALDVAQSSPTCLLFSPVARTQTVRRVARETTITFADSSTDPIQFLELFYTSLQSEGAGAATLSRYRQEIDLIVNDNQAVTAIGQVAAVYAQAIGPTRTWRLHQVAMLIRAAANYLEREIEDSLEPPPIVLNVPTAGGKTEAFFAAGLFCAFYELQRRRRSVNVIKYPMTLLSSDQVARLARYSMVADKIAGVPLGIAYMVGGKVVYKQPDEVVERCPYPVSTNTDGMCGTTWSSYTIAGGVPTLRCPAGHELHLGIDNEQMLTRQCPTFIISTWDKFISQSAQRRLGLLFGAPRYKCPEHGFLDFAETNQSYFQGKPLPSSIECRVYVGGQPCMKEAQKASPVIPGTLIFDEGHLIRESDGTLDSHFETVYLHIAEDLVNRRPIPIVSTATIAGIQDFLEQLGLMPTTVPAYSILPEPDEWQAFFRMMPGEMQHDAIAVVPFDVMLTWAVPHLVDIFFETLAIDYGYDATEATAASPPGLTHLRQIMIYCSSYKNINALAEMNRNAIATMRSRRGRTALRTLQLSARSLSQVNNAQEAIDRVRNVEQQIVYATNIASIGIDIENLDVIFLFGLPSNVSEFIQAMNRTGRRLGRPAVCVAILGPNKERDMSYYRYWSQFINGVNRIIEPIPLNRFASSAAARTFNNIATALLLMSYAQRLKRKLFNAGELRAALITGTVDQLEVLTKLKMIYRTMDDPAQEYDEQIEQLWDQYQARLGQVAYTDYFSTAFAPDWMQGLRSIKRPVRVLYPQATNLIETVGAGLLITGDVDSDQTGEVTAENGAA